MSKVKVPVIFSGTEGFPPRRDGRYLGKYQQRVRSLLLSSDTAEGKSLDVSFVAPLAAVPGGG